MFNSNITKINGKFCTIMEDAYRIGYKLFKLNVGKWIWEIGEIDY